jgi:hypothetical protein
MQAFLNLVQGDRAPFRPFLVQQPTGDDAHPGSPSDEGSSFLSLEQPPALQDA